MRRAMCAGLLLAVIPFVAGCSGFWDTPSGSGSNGGCTTNCTTASSGPFYILSNGAPPQIAGATIASGKLASISGSPWQFSNPAYSMAISPSGTFLYVSTQLGTLFYPISSGVLGTQSQVTQDVNALAIQIDTTGTWLIEALQGTGQVTMAAVPLNTSTGGVAAVRVEVTTTYNVANAAVKSGIAISPDDKNVFVPLGSGGALVVPFNATAGAGASPFGSAALIPVAHSGGSVLSAAVDPQSRLFYLGEVAGSSDGSTGGLLAFTYSSLSGTLTQASGSPIAVGGTAPNAILPNAAGTYVYVATGNGTSTAGAINSFSVSSSGSVYTIAKGSSAATGIQPLSLAEDSTGQFLFALGGINSPFFDAFTFDSTTPGKLDPQIATSAASSPLAIVAAP